MASELCGFCLSPCSLLCSNCKKVSYCSKNHQKFDRKNHKPLCFPVKLQWSESFGNHLLATRDIKPGEVILADNPLVVGPRSNLPKSAQICLGCCNLIPANTSYECPYCHWLMCHADCHTVRFTPFEIRFFLQTKKNMSGICFTERLASRL